MKVVSTSFCIYCNARAATGQEHYLPRAFGRFQNFEMLKNRICTDCNGNFSLLEGQFCGPSPEGMFRQMLGIKGRPKHRKNEGKKKSIFYGHHYGTIAVEIMGRTSPEAKPIRWQIIPGEKKINELCQIIYTDDQGNAIHIPLTKEMTKEDLKKIIEEKGLKGRDSAEFFVSEEERIWVEKLLKETFPKVQIAWGEKGLSGKRVSVETKFELTDCYFRAIAKIGFHYFLKQFPHFNGHESCFDGIKNFVKNGGDWRPFVQGSDRQIIPEFKQGHRLINYGHILTAERDSDGIRAKAQFFVGPDHVPFVWEIKLSNIRSNIIFFEGKGHLFLYKEPSERKDYDGIIDEITAIQRPTLLALPNKNF